MTNPKLILGIDEAGRGCIIGPLVMAGVLATEEQIDILKKLGATDSKILTDIQRRTLYNSITKMSTKHSIIEIPPKEIDEAIKGVNGLNLNWLESTKTAIIINALKPDIAIIDCPSTNIQAYTNHLKKQLEQELELIVQHKADSEHTIVGAASIIAKVTRDNKIEEIKKRLGIDFGSGYLSDEKTVKFMKENWNKKPEIFRKSYHPYKKEQEEKAQKRLGEF
ncbi:ribonuclease HII [Candidatus Woesearchaeota archaeon]|nr:ribonuclease HII [Candidatus Woesearchaeota archaeon]